MIIYPINTPYIPHTYPIHTPYIPHAHPHRHPQPIHHIHAFYMKRFLTGRLDEYDAKINDLGAGKDPLEHFAIELHKDILALCIALGITGKLLPNLLTWIGLKTILHNHLLTLLLLHNGFDHKQLILLNTDPQCRLMNQSLINLTIHGRTIILLVIHSSF